MAAALEMQSLPFDPADARTVLAQLPQCAAVFALYGAEAHAEPYSGRTPTCADASNGCSFLLTSIPNACNWLGACGAWSGGSQALSLNLCWSSLRCCTRFMEQSLLSACI